MFVAIMAFFARISDPAVGGTYMTMLNTLTNLGGNWPATLALWSVDHLTWKRCQIDLNEVKSSNIRYCSFTYNLHNYFNLHICPSLRRRRRRRHVTLLNFQFLQSIHKMSIIKVAWHVFRVKSMHSWSPSES